MKKNVYLKFETLKNENYFLYYDSIKKENELILSKNNPINTMIQLLENDKTISQIIFIKEHNNIYDLIYKNNDFILLSYGDEFTLIDLKNNDINYFNTTWWVNDENDLKELIQKRLLENNININDNILNDIIKNYNYLYE